MFQSSTPDGLAPIGTIALIVFISAIGGLSIIWGILNLFLLLRLIPEGQNSQKMERVFQLNRKLLRSAIDITKLTILIAFAATLIFFLLIMGTVQHFHSFYYSTSYILGAINSIFIAVLSTIVSCLVLPRIINFARFSLYDAYDAAKKAANFQSYFFIGWNITIVGLFLVIYQMKYVTQLKKPQQILRIAKCLVCFSFGSCTVSIGSRIISSIYDRGSNLAVQMLPVVNDRLRKDHKHPALICKSLGQIINKCSCTVLDSVMYMNSSISVCVYAAAYNIVGTDQQGQIIFQYAIDNCYLPILSVLFSLFYSLLFNMVFGIVIRPSTGEGVRTILNLHRYATTVLMIGFQCLAAYLCLPAQFFIDQLGQYVRHPYHAYLCLLFGLVVCIGVSTIAQILSTHPYFLNTISNSCRTGSATNVIYGLSFGYMFNFLPVIVIGGTLFLSDYWLGAYGIGLAVVGFLTLLPHYVFGSLIYSYLQNASYIAYLAQIDQSVIQSMVQATKTRKDYQPHVSYYYNGLIAYLGFQLVLVFINSAQYKQSTSLRMPTIFLGLLVGAMFPYLYNACLIRSIFKSAPAIIYDIKLQIDQIPAMANGNMDPDYVRTSGLFGFQCILSLKRFVPSLLGPIVVIGIAGGPPVVIGFLVGCVISGIQIAFSAGMSGCVWSTVKKQITFNNLRDEEGNTVKADSDWGRAAEVGNSVGAPMKDCVAPALPAILVYWGLQSFVFASLYASIHP